jgi:hypothetical protein
MLKITALKTASSRTKNRAASHGKEGFILDRRETSSKLFFGKPAILVTSVTKTAEGNKRWFGWLPEEEIIVEEIS